MEELEDIKNKINDKLAERSDKVVNNNAYQALCGAFSDPVGALGKIFLGRQDALDAAKSTITQDTILELLVNIDRAISNASHSLKSEGIDWIEISGSYEVDAVNSSEAIGIDIESGSGPVELKTGTHVKVTGNNVDKITGLKIGS